MTVTLAPEDAPLWAGAGDRVTTGAPPIGLTSVAAISCGSNKGLARSSRSHDSTTAAAISAFATMRSTTWPFRSWMDSRIPEGSGCTWTRTASAAAGTARTLRSASACSTADAISLSPSSTTGAAPSAEAADARTTRSGKSTTAIIVYACTLPSVSARSRRPLREHVSGNLLGGGVCRLPLDRDPTPLLVR